MARGGTVAARGTMIRMRCGKGAAVAVAIAAAALIAVTWFATLVMTSNRRVAEEVRLAANVANLAALFAERVQSELQEVDQTLHVVARIRETEPGRFQLMDWRNDLRAANMISPDLFITDEHGIVRDSTVPDAIGSDLSDRDYFHALAERIFDNGRMFVSRSSLGGLVRQWHMNLARPLYHADGSFAGVIVAALRLTGIGRFYRMANIGSHGVVALVGLEHGDLRFALAVNPIDPGTSIAASDMFGAIRADPDTVWVGRTALDGVARVHGFHRIVDGDMAVVVALDHTEAMEPTEQWIFIVRLFAGAVTALTLLLAAALVYAIRTARRRRQARRRDRAVLASANTELELAAARADEKSAQLEGVLSSMAEGAAIFDAGMQLVQWNANFPRLAGVPPNVLRPGQPIEEIWRAQHAAETAAEVAHDGSPVRLRRIRLSNGGLLVLCTVPVEAGEAADAPFEAAEQAQAPPAAADGPAVLCHPRLEELQARLPADALAGWVESRLSALSDRLTLLLHAAERGAVGEVDALAGSMADTAAECGLLRLESSLRMLVQATGQKTVAPGDLAADLPAKLAQGAIALRRAFHIEMA